MPINKLSLGDYEKQVLLELDNQLTLAQSQWVRNQDPSLTMVHGSVEASYESEVDVTDCVIYILKLYRLPTNECVLINEEATAIKGYD